MKNGGPPPEGRHHSPGPTQPFLGLDEIRTGNHQRRRMPRFVAESPAGSTRRQGIQVQARHRTRDCRQRPQRPTSGLQVSSPAWERMNSPPHTAYRVPAFGRSHSTTVDCQGLVGKSTWPGPRPAGPASASPWPAAVVSCRPPWTGYEQCASRSCAQGDEMIPLRFAETQVGQCMVGSRGTEHLPGWRCSDTSTIAGAVLPLAGRQLRRRRCRKPKHGNYSPPRSRQSLSQKLFTPLL